MTSKPTDISKVLVAFPHFPHQMQFLPINLPKVLLSCEWALTNQAAHPAHPTWDPGGREGSECLWEVCASALLTSARLQVTFKHTDPHLNT